MTARRNAGWAMVAVVVSLAVAPAQALEPGVHADPSGPASKEYALVLAAARNEAAGGGSGSAPLFGLGISAFGRPRPATGTSATRVAAAPDPGVRGRVQSSTGHDQHRPIAGTHAGGVGPAHGPTSLGHVRGLELGTGGGLVEELLICAAVLLAGGIGAIGLAGARRHRD